ncbi:hypothetical protein [Roseinatronobacter bogoriensis]|nr:hypothetical protein [Rhodobaca]MBB4206352.1 preprotein translocase subunit SecD [Rhodobaca bogoriensis DSM 18756]
MLLLAVASPAIPDEAGIPLRFQAASASFAIQLQDMEIALDTSGPKRMFFRMTAKDSFKFGEFSAAVIGERVVTTVCGKVIAQSVVQVPINSGVFALHLDDRALAEMITSIVRKEAECPENADD